jgi:hypothetical protein
MGKAPVLILPGLYDSGPLHWQTRWEALDSTLHRVVQRDWQTPRCADWVLVLEGAVAAAGEEVVLVGHSSACALVAHWAGGTSRRVRGALLVGPSDPEAPSYPAGPTGFAPMPLARLPFASIVVASSDDPYVSLSRARAFASAWGSRFVDAGAAGHLNSDSGLGDWGAGRALLAELREQRP